MKPFLLIALLAAAASAGAQTPLSYAEARQLLHKNSRTLKMADRGVASARAERDKLQALWYPSLQASGAYVHLSEKIEVKQPLSRFTDPAKDLVHTLLPDDKFISGILDQIGTHSLAFPLAPRNLTTVGLTAEWVLFSGGKRLRAGRIGNRMIDLAREARAQTDAAQQTLLVESYYGLTLAREVATVRRDAYRALSLHYENALKLEAAGMLDKAGRLFAQVNRDEARRALDAARRDAAVAQSALCSLLCLEEDTDSIVPTSPLFINARLPPKEEFLQAMRAGSPLLARLALQQDIARQQLRIDQSAYLPDVALFGKQTLLAHGIRSNIVPRTILGVGFTWNLFDGLAREKRIRQSRLARQTLALGREQAEDDLSVGIDKLYAGLLKAQDNVQALHASIELARELVRIRRRSFAEGMATSAEVVDAETMLAEARVARLAAYYEYDVGLMNLLALCGRAEGFGGYCCTTERTDGYR